MGCIVDNEFDVAAYRCYRSQDERHGVAGGDSNSQSLRGWAAFNGAVGGALRRPRGPLRLAGRKPDRPGPAQRLAALWPAAHRQNIDPLPDH
ncbi:protein of unknown function [Candidatus Promineifilum breve]|uniref:Uncharacterized protein n=1 Tax=Candidatus Promineifilum breve TaxID=1806508 RepID=A0A160SZS7_9CHLR|nr:protein of unknown function [Candidatus Promineifilum breve]